MRVWKYESMRVWGKDTIVPVVPGQAGGGSFHSIKKKHKTYKNTWAYRKNHAPARILKVFGGQCSACRHVNICYTLNNAQSERNQPATSPNTAPATQKECHDWSISRMKRQLQCAELQAAPPNLTKYCPCHAKGMSWSILLSYENVIYNARSNRHHLATSPNTAPATQKECHDRSFSRMKRHFTMRGATGITLQILRLPRKRNVMIDPCRDRMQIRKGARELMEKVSHARGKTLHLSNLRPLTHRYTLQKDIARKRVSSTISGTWEQPRTCYKTSASNSAPSSAADLQPGERRPPYDSTVATIPNSAVNV